MSDIPHEIVLRFGALVPSLSEQILVQIPDIVERMGQEPWLQSTRIWEDHKISITNLFFSSLITDKEKTKLITRLNKSIVRELKRACFGKCKKARGGDPA
jgi:hypothetical protein